MTYIHIKYTTPDGQEHEQTVPIAEHPIVGITGVWVEGVRIPDENVTVDYPGTGKWRCGNTLCVPPWWCTRDAGHAGPCAAIKLESIQPSTKRCADNCILHEGHTGQCVYLTHHT